MILLLLLFSHHITKRVVRSSFQRESSLLFLAFLNCENKRLYSKCLSSVFFLSLELGGISHGGSVECSTAKSANKEEVYGVSHLISLSVPFPLSLSVLFFFCSIVRWHFLFVFTLLNKRNVDDRFYFLVQPSVKQCTFSTVVNELLWALLLHQLLLVSQRRRRRRCTR